MPLLRRGFSRRISEGANAPDEQSAGAWPALSFVLSYGIGTDNAFEAPTSFVAVILKDCSI